MSSKSFEGNLMQGVQGPCRLCMALHGFAWLCMALLVVWSCGSCCQEAKSTIEARLQEAEASQASLTAELQDLAQLCTSWRFPVFV